MRLALFALVVFAGCLALAAGGRTGNKPSIYEREGHLHDLRERLGHFKQQPFIDLYKQYATAFVYPKHKHERPKDDYRNYMPSGQECLVFFKHFRQTQYEPKDFNDLIVLDACLGFLFDKDNHELDNELSADEKQHVQTLRADELLVGLYSGTKINELNDDAQGCVADLLLSNVLAKYQFGAEVDCNNHYLQMFLQFAECQQGVITAEERTGDSYLKIVYELLRKRAHVCFETEVGHIEQALRAAYIRDTTLRTKLLFKAKFWRKNTLAKQQREYMWPEPVVKLLAAVQGTRREVNMRQVHELIKGFYDGDQKLIGIFLKNIGDFTNASLRPKPTDKGDVEAVQNRYRELIDRTCKYFRSSDNERDYDYATPLIRMVELLNHQDLFDITAKQFVDHMIGKAHETAPVYYSVSACNLLTFTEANIPRLNTNSVQKYEVAFYPDTSKMIKWPVATYY